MTEKKEISLENLRRIIEKGFGEKLEFEQTKSGDISITVSKDQLLPFCRFVRDSKELKCNYLRCLFGVDSKDSFGVIYHVYSISKWQGFLIKVKLPRKEPLVSSVTSIWEAADWYERETAEMFGITFEGHPDPRNILLPDDFKGYPLRKKFPLPDEEKTPTRRSSWESWVIKE